MSFLNTKFLAKSEIHMHKSSKIIIHPNFEVFFHVPVNFELVRKIDRTGGVAMPPRNQVGKGNLVFELLVRVNDCNVRAPSWPVSR